MFNTKKSVLLLALSGLISLAGYAQNDMKSEEQYKKLFYEKHKNAALDLADIRIAHQHTSGRSQIRHVHFQQYYEGLRVASGAASVHIDSEGKIISLTDNFLLNLRERIKPHTLKLNEQKALNKALDFYKAECKKLNPTILILEPKVQSEKVYEADGEDLILCYRFHITSPEFNRLISIKADSGELLASRNLLQSCSLHSEADSAYSPHDNTRCASGEKVSALQASLSESSSFAGQYNIFPLPVESPLYGVRNTVAGLDIIDNTASPYGWHDTDGDASTLEFDYTRGNNSYAFYAPFGTAEEPGAQAISRSPITNEYLSGNVPVPSGASLNFNYNNSTVSTDAKDFLEDAVTNAFAITNQCHDIFYLYGFDEAAGNFQHTNHSGTGTGGDEILVRVQNGDGFNQASYSPAVEGQKPSIRLNLWTTGAPNQVDCSFDNGLIIHEYAHGLTSRLIGGPSNINCFTNVEHGAEGWSDYFALMLTMQDFSGNGQIDAAVLGEGIRSMGTYVLNESANEEGIRPRYYTNEMDESASVFNEMVYSDVNSLAFPHGTGFLWCTMLWDMTLSLIEEYGFQPNIYAVNDNAGNIRAMHIVTEAIKMTPCEPDFIDMRDAVLAAAEALYGANDKRIAWEAFARRGLGFSAAAGGNAAFDLPDIQILKTLDLENAFVGDNITYTLRIKNNAPSAVTNVIVTDDYASELAVQSMSDGGNDSGGILTWPAVASLAPGQEFTRTFTASINANDGTSVLFEEPVESAAPLGFVSSGAWITDSGKPKPGGSTLHFWHLNPLTSSESDLILNLNLGTGQNSHLSFWQFYNTEPTKDGGVVEIFEGGQWLDLGTKMIKGAYNSFIFDVLNTPVGVPLPSTNLSGRRAFTGDSGVYLNTIIDLSDFSGLKQIRFRFASDNSNTDSNCANSLCEGWYLDDFKLLDLRHILNTACVTTSEGAQDCGDVGQVGTVYEANALPVELLNFSAEALQQEIILTWITSYEYNNKGFFLQRRAEYENSFKNITWLNSLSENGAEYEYIDQDVREGIKYYYRLKQVDYSEYFEYSEIREAQIKAEKVSFFLSPNPVSEALYLSTGLSVDAMFSYEILNVSGQVIRKEEVSSGARDFIIPVGTLQAGTYYLRLRAEAGTQSMKFIKV